MMFGKLFLKTRQQEESLIPLLGLVMVFVLPSFWGVQAELSGDDVCRMCFP